MLVQFPHVHVWLLGPEIVRLAAARSDVMSRAAGRDPIIVMDDDLHILRLTHGSRKNGCAG